MRLRWKPLFNDGLIPFERETPDLDSRKQFPVLSYLARNFASAVREKVIYPGPATTYDEHAGPRMAAINVCTFEGALPVTEEVDRYLKEEGLDALHFLGRSPDDGFYRITKDCLATMAIRGYQGEETKTTNQWLVRDNASRTVYVDQIGRRGEKRSTPGDSVDTLNNRDLRAGIDQQTQAGEPVFLMVRFASEAGMNAFSIVQGMMDRLKADSTATRKLCFVPPCDLAASYRARAGGREKGKGE